MAVVIVISAVYLAAEPRGAQGAAGPVAAAPVPETVPVAGKR